MVSRKGNWKLKFKRKYGLSLFEKEDFPFNEDFNIEIWLKYNIDQLIILKDFSKIKKVIGSLKGTSLTFPMSDSLAQRGFSN